MALYQPTQIFTYPDGNCISHISVQVKNGEGLQLELNETLPVYKITHIRYKVIKDKSRD
ncbi:MAG: hypothetical protein K8R53_01200 [Bacteroidales bacterium]|nr:hypothetical protein [Bacteroidales bacterium]